MEKIQQEIDKAQAMLHQEILRNPCKEYSQASDLLIKAQVRLTMREARLKREKRK